jgi:hypothetical protein
MPQRYGELVCRFRMPTFLQLLPTKSIQRPLTKCVKCVSHLSNFVVLNFQGCQHSSYCNLYFVTNWTHKIKKDDKKSTIPVPDTNKFAVDYLPTSLTLNPGNLIHTYVLHSVSVSETPAKQLLISLVILTSSTSNYHLEFMYSAIQLGFMNETSKT